MIRSTEISTKRLRWLFAGGLILACTAALLAQSAEDSLADSYREPAGRILGAALVDQEGWNKLEHLTTVIGHRLSGSRGLEQAIEWAEATMKAEGLRVRLEPVMVPHWVRGDEWLEVDRPSRRRLGMLGLGGSVGTPAEGLEAEVVVVTSFDELAALPDDAVRGKIVVYAVEWQGYGRTVAYRSGGASRAAAKGAVAALVRSATGNSLYTPHTGAMRYSDSAPKIPAAAITPEDARWFLRMREAGEPVRARLYMEAETLPDAQSYNVIAEIPGRETPEEVVVMGGHYDSWDVGQGAHDDGAACIAAWQALKIVSDLGLQPRRTLRVVLWTNEENGIEGGRVYRENLGDEVASHVAAIEMDGGNEKPVGFGFSLPGHASDGSDPVYEAAFDKLTQIGSLLEMVEAGTITRGGGGADIGPLMRDGVPGMGLRTVGEHYFDWHHTHADTLDKVEPRDFRVAVAMLGVMGYVLADMEDTLAP